MQDEPVPPSVQVAREDITDLEREVKELRAAQEASKLRIAELDAQVRELFNWRIQMQEVISKVGAMRPAEEQKPVAALDPMDLVPKIYWNDNMTYCEFVDVVNKRDVNLCKSVDGKPLAFHLTKHLGELRAPNLRMTADKYRACMNYMLDNGLNVFREYKGCSLLRYVVEYMQNIERDLAMARFTLYKDRDTTLIDGLQHASRQLQDICDRLLKLGLQ